jgi:hypothetical protein
LPYTTKGINEKFFRGVSKVMGKEPKIVWHGSNEEYNIFDNKKGLPYFYFTDKKQVAKLYGNIVKPYYLNIKNPIFFYADCSNFNDLGNKTSIVHKLMNALIDAKKFNSKQYVYYYGNEYVIESENDGIIIKDIVDSNVEDMLDENNQEKIYNYYCSDFFIVTESNQIKLADGSNTTFDGSNPDIRYADGGYIGSCVDVGSGKKEVCKYFPDATIMAQYVGNPDENDWGKSKETTSKEFYKFVSKNDVPKKAINGEHSYHYIAQDSYGRDMTINDTAIYFIYNVDSDIHYFFKKTKYELGGEIILTTEQVENKLGRELDWWKDDVVDIGGQKYKKVYLRPEYKLVTE